SSLTFSLFNLRTPSKLHSEIAARATGEDKSINQRVAETLKNSVAS
ncbi:MAG: putative HicB family RNase H-like nuclease, partial [Pseudohongiellaceae bacterium]